MHFSTYSYGVENTIRMFELIYKRKFCDVVADKRVQYTGYNSELGIAFVHGNDYLKNYGTLSLEFIKKYSVHNNILMFTFPENTHNSYDIICDFVRVMIDSPLSPPPWQEIIQKSFIKIEDNDIKAIAGVIKHELRVLLRDNLQYQHFARC
jgi:hypothetical protein